MKKVIELIRVSTESQADSDRASIPAQRSVNRRTCAQYGLEIVHSIEISDVSGTSVLLAPEITRLLAAMQSVEIHGVVAREFSRLMRPENFSDYALLQAFVDTRTMLYLPEGPIDLTSKTGRLMGTIRAAMAGLERTEILERVWSAKEEKRRRGELAQSAVVLPFGVGYDKARGFYYKPESERVREAFRLFLAGNQSYQQLAALIGVTPRGMHLILRNPIWIGWRIIDKKRDLSPAGKYVGKNGRQADRRKIMRHEDEVIRVRVISPPLISEADFQAVQAIMNLKQQKHWRCQPNVEHRFTYSGFLTCAACGQVIHTALARRDYYACKGRRVDHVCKTKYMGREKLEAVLDALFSQRLTSPDFVGECVEVAIRQSTQDDSVVKIQRLTAELQSLREKRTRVLDAFLEGIISRRERDDRFAEIARGTTTAENLLLTAAPCDDLNTESLISSFSALGEWEFWSREQKRTVLASLVPDICVADYKVQSIGIKLAEFSNKKSHGGKDSWPQ